jgi:hypothetical protein
MNTMYIEVSKTWVEKNQGFEKSGSRINARQTISGSWVVSLNTLIDFPELFGERITIIKDLTTRDFPLPEVEI